MLSISEKKLSNFEVNENDFAENEFSVVLIGLICG